MTLWPLDSNIIKLLYPLHFKHQVSLWSVIIRIGLFKRMYNFEQKFYIPLGRYDLISRRISP